MHSDSVAVIGAGPAGLSAAYLLAKNDVPVTVLEADPTYVGGISRTARYKGFHFDIGGHRFFSKSKAIEDLGTRFYLTTCSTAHAVHGSFIRENFLPIRCDRSRRSSNSGHFRPPSVSSPGSRPASFQNRTRAISKIG